MKATRVQRKEWFSAIAAQGYRLGGSTVTFTYRDGDSKDKAAAKAKADRLAARISRLTGIPCERSEGMFL